jgi:hypothetical protein
MLDLIKTGPVIYFKTATWNGNFDGTSRGRVQITYPSLKIGDLVIFSYHFIGLNDGTAGDIMTYPSFHTGTASFDLASSNFYYRQYCVASHYYSGGGSHVLKVTGNGTLILEIVVRKYTGGVMSCSSLVHHVQILRGARLF